MIDSNQGRITGVNGNLVTVEFDTYVTQNEVAYAMIGDKQLKAEVIRVRGRRADLQVFESTVGLKVGDPIQFTPEELRAKGRDAQRAIGQKIMDSIRALPTEV